MKKLSLILFIAALNVLMMLGVSSALLLNHGSSLLIVDGDGDIDKMVTVGSSIFTDYTLGYFLNGSDSFVDLFGYDAQMFAGGDIVDFALYDNDNDKYLTLSGDMADNLYSTTMNFRSAIDSAHAEVPVDLGMAEYYINLEISWNIDDHIIRHSVAVLSAGNDGIAPAPASAVPEPSTLLLLGSGLYGLGILKRKFKNG